MLRLESSSAAPCSLPETRVWASRLSVPHGVWSEPSLTRSSHQSWSDGCTTFASECGKYTQADPVGLQAGTNLFSYVHGNPINMIDPFGLRAELVCRPVGTGGHPIPGSRHCRLRVTCDRCEDAPPEIDITVGMEFTGNPPYTINEWAYPSGLSAYTETWPVVIEGGDQCNFARCVRAYNRLFSRGYTGGATRFVPAYSIPGPNSNTYAARLIDICGGMGAFPPGAIGSGGYPGTPTWGY